MVALLAFLAVVGLAAGDGPRHPARAARAFRGPPEPAGDGLEGLKAGANVANRMNQYRQAMGKVAPALEENPDDADLFALMGTSRSRLGLYADAVTDFVFADGSVYYNRGGLDAHADALRAFGEGRQAAELRLLQPLFVDGARAQVLAWQGAVHDLRSVGAFDEALAVAEEAYAYRPRLPTALALMAEASLDLGEREEAQNYVYDAILEGDRSLDLLMVETRMAMMDGDYELAAEVASEAHNLRRKSKDVLAVRANALRLAGRPDEALTLIDMPRWGQHEIPHLMAVEAMVLWDMGYPDEAHEVLDRALALYPQNPDVTYARDHLRGLCP